MSTLWRHKRSPHFLEDYETQLRTLCSMCSDCLEMIVLGKNLDDQIYYGQLILWHDQLHIGTKHAANTLIRLISCINQNNNDMQFCHVGNQIEDCKLGLFQSASFAGDVLVSISTSGGLLCVCWIAHVDSHLMDVHHSNAESEVFALEAG